MSEKSDLRSATISGGGNAASTAQLSPGEVLANRFRIVRFLAAGGTGDVYEAEDTELNELVALKTIRVNAADAPSAIDRFRGEVQLSRKVTHANVCRVFDLAHDQSEARGSITFLTMQLLPGETLAARLRRTSRMSTAEALPLALDMAEALSAAHAAGIIHRDFKPGNVILIPSEDREHAVVTDFGLASLKPGPDSSTQTDQPERWSARPQRLIRCMRISSC